MQGLNSNNVQVGKAKENKEQKNELQIKMIYPEFQQYSPNIFFHFRNIKKISNKAF